jgi:5-methylthioadenosine/S-adenosylhomocysteine deaminase
MAEQGRAMKTLIKGGIVISMDPAVGDLRPGDVLIEDGAIVEVAGAIDVQADELIDASQMVVLPGLIDPHRHLWYGAQRAIAYDGTYPMLLDSVWPKVGLTFQAQDVYASMRAGIADALNGGITSVLDWCHVMNSPAHVEAAVRAHLESPLRAVFGFGPSMARKGTQGDEAQYASWDEARDVYAQTFPAHSGRLSLALAIQGTENDSIEEARHDITTARDIGVPVTLHVGYPQGGHRYAVKKLQDDGLMGPDIQFVHCNGTTDEEFKMIADAGATVAISPATEVAIGMGIPPTGRARAQGVTPSFGCDAIIATSGDMFDEARAGLLLERAVGQQRLYARGEEVASSEDLGFTSREALEAITINAARSIWLGDRVGSLSPGKRADVILLRATDLNLAPMNNVVETLVSCAHAGNVDTVLVDGKAVKRDGKLIGIDERQIASELTACRERVFAQADYEGVVPPVAVAAAAR